ncbi:MAG: dihydroorotate dehydrogenase-like protein [Acidimicrobiales bacterium]|nr:dihydroorotate dehydrogenase-like protein [Acidimicrobiales bacterium]RZV46526.1 MAG: dihydroorotate dehydrogenase-like protein [Acidimicrobiales bacterium]
MDLQTTYLGLDLKHPIVASSSPLTGNADGLRSLEKAGAAAVVLPSLFEEQVEHDAFAREHELHGTGGFAAEAHEGFIPLYDDYNSGVDDYVKTLQMAKQELSIPVIASVNGTSAGGWTEYARTLQDEGADAIELNVYYVAADIDATAADVEKRYVDLVRDVRDAIDVPLAVKIGPYFSSPANMARQLVDAGADALVLFNRFYQPDINLEDLTVVPNIVLSSPGDMRLALRWIAILRGRIDANLAATTGVHDADGVVKLMLAGADVAMMTSAFLQHGPEHLTSVLDGVRSWFEERGYDSLEQARGSLSQASVPDPSAFERANYMMALVSYAP